MLVAEDDGDAAAAYAHEKDDSLPAPDKKNNLFAMGFKWGWQRVRPSKSDGDSLRQPLHVLINPTC